MFQLALIECVEVFNTLWAHRRWDDTTVFPNGLCVCCCCWWCSFFRCRHRRCYSLTFSMCSPLCLILNLRLFSVVPVYVWCDYVQKIRIRFFLLGTSVFIYIQPFCVVLCVYQMHSDGLRARTTMFDCMLCFTLIFFPLYFHLLCVLLFFRVYILVVVTSFISPLAVVVIFFYSMYRVHDSWTSPVLWKIVM